jgi:hypothetical protein
LESKTRCWGGLPCWWVQNLMKRKISSASCGAQKSCPPALPLTIADLGPLLRSGLVGGAGGSLSALGYRGRFQAEGAADRREPVPTAAAIGAAAKASAPAPQKRGSAVLDLDQPLVRRLAQFAPHCETRDRAEVASTGLARLLVVAVTWGTREGPPPDCPATSSADPTDDCRKSAVGSKTDPSRTCEIGVYGFCADSR